MTYDATLSGRDGLAKCLTSHPDDLCPVQYVIPMTYHTTICHPDDLAEVGISPGWVTALLLCHPDAPTLNSSGWDSSFRFFTTHHGSCKLILGLVSANAVVYVHTHQINWRISWYFFSVLLDMICWFSTGFLFINRRYNWVQSSWWDQ